MPRGGAAGETWAEEQDAVEEEVHRDDQLEVERIYLPAHCGRRQELHARVAATLEEHFADLVERQPELLAHHLTAADITERAVSDHMPSSHRRTGTLGAWLARDHSRRLRAPVRPNPTRLPRRQSMRPCAARIAKARVPIGCQSAFSFA
jgi:hypothetical protein